jgi:formamidopyrimidine-DNA glycosylase
MIEYPEAVTIARQITERLNGKRIVAGVRGNAPHKFAFYSGTAEEYANIIQGKQIGQAEPHGSLIKVNIDPGYVLMLGGGGERILFRARLHPRRRAVEISKRERRALYKAIRSTIQQAVDGGGRDTEHGLFDEPGRYYKLLDSRTVGAPCPECGTPIEKISFLGGASYFCPTCQVLPETEKHTPRAARVKPGKSE